MTMELLDDLLDELAEDLDQFDWRVQTLLKMNDDRPAVVASAECDDLGTVAGRAYRLATELLDVAVAFKQRSDAFFEVARILQNENYNQNYDPAFRQQEEVF